MVRRAASVRAGVVSALGRDPVADSVDQGGDVRAVAAGRDARAASRSVCGLVALPPRARHAERRRVPDRGRRRVVRMARRRGRDVRRDVSALGRKPHRPRSRDPVLRHRSPDEISLGAARQRCVRTTADARGRVAERNGRSHGRAQSCVPVPVCDSPRGQALEGVESHRVLHRQVAAVRRDRGRDLLHLTGEGGRFFPSDDSAERGRWPRAVINATKCIRTRSTRIGRV
ncbi:hypothetical protein BCEN4_850050 [Burkholderia cenocepacia]|nr:hypothetical protein BCEN4_850050 [Burkholderia cenocepacia]